MASVAVRSPFDREILRLAVPAFGALIAEPLYLLTDTAVVGHLGTPQLGGLAVANTVLLGSYMVFIFLAYGTTAAVSRLMGAGDEREAAHQVAWEIWSFLAYALDAIAIAGQAIVGRSLGAGDGEGARGAGRRMIEWGVALGIAVGVVLLVSRSLLPHVFTDDTQVIHLTAFLLVWVAVLQPLNGIAFVLDGVLIGAGDQAFLAWAMVVAAVVFVVAAGAVLALDLGIGWLWAAIAVLMATRASMLLARFSNDRWIVLGAHR
jgi:Na+-driven multidrug efflux pump